jgi:hypothetical protein
LLADDQRVAGIMAALEARNHIGPAGQPVDDLALALVAPWPPITVTLAIVQHPGHDRSALERDRWR